MPERKESVNRACGSFCMLRGGGKKFPKLTEVLISTNYSQKIQERPQ